MIHHILSMCIYSVLCSVNIFYVMMWGIQISLKTLPYVVKYKKVGKNFRACR